MNQWKESRRAGRKKTALFFSEPWIFVFDLILQGNCTMSCGQAMFHLSSSWESYFSYSCVFQLLHECSSVGLKHFELRFVKDPCHTPLIPQTHSSHSNGVVKWRWKRNQALSAARPAKQVNHRKTQKMRFYFFLSSFMFFLYVCFLRIWKDIKRERERYIYISDIYICVCVYLMRVLGEVWHRWRY